MKEIEFFREPETDEPKTRPAPRSKGSLGAPIMRTFSNDVEDLIKEKSITKTQVIVAERERTRIQNDETHESHGLGKIILVLLLLLTFGVGVGLYVLIGTKTPGVSVVNETKKDTAPQIQPISIEIGKGIREEVLAGITVTSTKTTTDHSITPLLFVITNEKNETNNATAAEVLRALSSSPPPLLLLRSLNPSVHFSIEVRGTTPISKVECTTHDATSTLAGMLDWEHELSSDLIPALRPTMLRKNIFSFRDRLFVDKRIENEDARILYGSDGVSVLAYAVTHSQLLITGDESSLRDALIELHQSSH